jgi:heptosyltransferase-2
MATPFFRDLHQVHPQAHISVLLKKYLWPVLQGNPAIQECLAWKSGGGRLALWELWKKLRHRSFQEAYLLTNSFSSALFFSTLRIQNRIGYQREGRGFLLQTPVRPLKEGLRFTPLSMVAYYQKLLSAQGYAIGNDCVELFYTEADIQKSREFLEKMGVTSTRPYALLNPGASFGSAKCWKPEYFAQVGDRLITEMGLQVLILCGPADEERRLAQEIQKQMKSPGSSSHEFVLSLQVLKAVVAQATLMVTNDSGPRHYASAFQIPCVTIFGSTHQAWSAYTQTKSIALQKEVPCGPCMQRICPETLQGRSHLCMESVLPQDVFSAIQALLAKDLPL